MQSAGVLVGVFISLCLRLCAVDSSNLTKTSAAIGNRRQNESFAFGDPTNEAEEHPVAADEAQVTERTDVLDGGTEGHRITPKWESGWFVAGCYADKESDRDLPVGPFSITGSDPYPACAAYCMEKGNRYAGLQRAPEDPTTVLCYCGLTVGRHGLSRRCIVPCPGSKDDTLVCGNKLVNTVIYVYRVRRSTFQDMYIGTAAVVIVTLLVVNTAVITGFAIYLVIVARRRLN